MDDFISSARRVDRDYAESNCMFTFKANFEIVENADSLPKSERNENRFGPIMAIFKGKKNYVYLERYGIVNN